MSGMPHVPATKEERSIVSALCLMVLGPIFFLIMPTYVDAVSESLHLSASQIGTLTAIELGGAAISSISILFLLGRLNFSTLTLNAGIILMLLNGFCVFLTPPFNALFIVRFAAGIFEGCLVSVGVYILGQSANPDRLFAFAITGQMILSGFLLFLLPYGIRRWDISVIFFVLGISVLPVTALSHFLPSVERDEKKRGSFSGANLRPLWGLFGMALFFAGETVVWAFIERIGSEVGLSKFFIGTTLAISSIFAISGSLLASWVAGRIHRLIVMIVAASGQIVCLLWIADEFGTWAYFIVVMLYQILWCLWLPFQMGAIAEIDDTGRFIILSPPFQALGIAIGPALVAPFLSDDNLIAINVGGILFATLSILFFLPIILKRKPKVAIN